MAYHSGLYWQNFHGQMRTVMSTVLWANGNEILQDAFFHSQMRIDIASSKVTTFFHSQMRMNSSKVSIGNGNDHGTIDQTSQVSLISSESHSFCPHC